MGNRFEGKLDKQHGVKLMDFRFNGIQYEIRTTQHSLDRFKDHGINIDEALTSIIALGKVRLDYYANEQTDVCIIDKIARISTIITFESEGQLCQIRIATIIPRTNVFVKDGTKVFCLKNYQGGGF